MKIVLLHAFPLDETMWTPQAEALAGYELAAPNLYDLPGNTVEAWAENLLDHLGGELVPVGASLGGYVALAMARRAPERIRALVLIGSRSGPDTPERRLVREQVLQTLREEGAEAFAAASPFDAPPGLSTEGLIRATEALRDRPDASDVVSSFGGPLLVVVGSNDELLSVDEAREIAASAPHGRLEVLEGAGHIVSQDEPKRFNAILRRFLDEVAAEATSG
jgi:pimeloyl-ACP methyl ester carboxylesterase